MAKKLTHEEWIAHLETLCFNENDDKRPSGVRKYTREDCKEGGEVFEKWMNRQEVDRLLRVLAKLEQ